MPPLDADGQRVVALRQRLVSLPPNVDGGWLLDRVGATSWDIELLGVVESVIEEERGDGC